MDKIISSSEIRRRFAEVFNDVSTNHQSYLVMRYGKPIVRIVPVDGSR